MLRARQNIHPLIYLLIGLLLGAGFGTLLFWGFPVAEANSSKQASTNAAGSDGQKLVNDAALLSGLELGAQAPDFKLRDVNGEEFSLSAQKGNVILLNFWATWCGPCLIEMPLLESEYQVFKDEGFLVLAVNDGESLQQVQKFGEENGLNFPLLLDPGRAIQRLYQIRGYPSSVFVDPQGRIQIIHIGLIQERQLAGYLEQLGLES